MEPGDFVEDECTGDTEGEVMHETETEDLKHAIKRLPEKARYVLIRRYGLDDRDPATRAEVGGALNLSRKRVRQLQRVAELALKVDAPWGRRARSLT